MVDRALKIARYFINVCGVEINVESCWSSLRRWLAIVSVVTAVGAVHGQEGDELPSGLKETI